MPRPGVRNEMRAMGWLLAVFVIYVVSPLRDIPLLGLSLSAPVFALIAFELARRGFIFQIFGKHPFARKLYLFLIGLFLASFLNGISGQSAEVPLIHTAHILAAYSYWVLTFLCISFVVSRGGSHSRVLSWVSGAVTVLALAVIAEYAMGQAGLQQAQGRLTWLTQNEIGIQFSAFGLAPLTMLVTERRFWFRILYFLSTLAVGLAVVVNSSRTSWIAMALGVGVIIALSRGFRWRARLAGIVIIGALILVGYVAVAPSNLVEKFQRRSATFQRLDTDKSWQTRIFLVRKALKLFLENPIAGIGPGNFPYYQVEGVKVSKSLMHLAGKVNRISGHNAYMVMLAEGGLITMVPLVSFLASLFLSGFRESRRLAGQGNPIGVFFLGMFVSLSVHLWTLSGLGSSGAWLVYSLVASVAMNRGRQEVVGLAPAHRRRNRRIVWSGRRRFTVGSDD